MAEELTGTEAFNLVLREAIDSGVNAEKMRLRANELEHQTRTDREDRERAYSRLNDFERQKKEALPKLKALWEAADAISKSTVENYGELRVILAHALREASDHCDQLPF